NKNVLSTSTYTRKPIYAITNEQIIALQKSIEMPSKRYRIKQKQKYQCHQDECLHHPQNKFQIHCRRCGPPLGIVARFDDRFRERQYENECQQISRQSRRPRVRGKSHAVDLKDHAAANQNAHPFCDPVNLSVELRARVVNRKTEERLRADEKQISVKNWITSQEPALEPPHQQQTLKCNARPPNGLADEHFLPLHTQVDCSPPILAWARGRAQGIFPSPQGLLRGLLRPWQWRGWRDRIAAIGNQNARALGLTRRQTLPFDVPRANLHHARENGHSNE